MVLGKKGWHEACPNISLGCVGGQEAGRLPALRKGERLVAGGVDDGLGDQCHRVLPVVN